MIGIRPIFATLCLLVAIPTTTAQADELEKAKASVAAHLHAWDMPAAGRDLEKLVAEHPDDVDVLHLRAHWAFLRGRYDEAAKQMDAAVEKRQNDKGLLAGRDLFQTTREVVKDFKSVPSSQGHFVISYRPGPDEVLVAYADEALEKAYVRLGEIFGYHPQEPVRVEIYPQAGNLADVSPLKESEIRTSGTIALCKYNRLMIVSPRALVYGYRWLDTLAHEYIHFLLTRRSGNRVPLWLHEGLAKFFEKLWRADATPRMDPMLQHLLAEGIRRKKLISLDRIHPSIGKLPSQDDAALAFAEVYSLVDYLVRREGRDGLSRLVQSLSEGQSLDDALEMVYDLTFRKVRRGWRRWLKKRTYRRIPKAYRSRMLFRGTDRKEDELDGIREERGRDLIYLGDLLRARDRHDAALEEYRKAVHVVGSSSPVLQGKMAAAFAALGRFAETLAAVQPVLPSYPGHVLLHLYEGEALLRLGRAEEAVGSLVRAIGLNPFDPKVHRLLAEAYQATGRDEAAAFERRQHALVGED